MIDTDDLIYWAKNDSNIGGPKTAIGDNAKTWFQILIVDLVRFGSAGPLLANRTIPLIKRTQNSCGYNLGFAFFLHKVSDIQIRNQKR